MEEQMLNISFTANLIGVIISFFFWVSLYFSLCRVNKHRSYEWNCRTVTAIHAVLTVILSGWCGFVQGPWPFTDPGGPNTPLQHLTVMISSGYFIYDLSWCLYMKTEGLVMLLHHMLTIFGQTVTVFRLKYGTEMIAAIFGSELTNPFLQLRWFFRASGKHHTWYAEVNDVIFMLLFGILRVGIASNLLYNYLLHPRPDFIGKFGGSCIYGIGLIFWLMIVRYAIRKYTKMYSNYVNRKKGTKSPVNGNAHEANGYLKKTS